MNIFIVYVVGIIFLLDNVPRDTWEKRKVGQSEGFKCQTKEILLNLRSQTNFSDEEIVMYLSMRLSLFNIY